MLNSERLKNAILAKMETASGAPPPPDWVGIAEAIAEAVVEELSSNAVVNPGTMQDSTPAAITGAGTIA